MQRLLLLVVVACIGTASKCGPTPPTPSDAAPTPVMDAAPQPVPPATSDAALPDPFAGQIFDCHSVTLAQRKASLTPVGACLAAGGCVACCLSNAVSGSVLGLASVACVARDLGASANAAVLSGDSSQAPTANNARSWITSEKLGYK